MRCVTGSAAYRSATALPVPRGIRTVTARPGGVTPRTNCGLSSTSAAGVVSASRAITSSPVASGIRISSNTSGGSGWTSVKP